MTATGRNRDEVARERAKYFEGVKPLVTRQEVDEAIAEQRRIWEQQNQQQ
ncbi:MAG: hypothetical protein H7Z72_06870 [Bacteroidetes bacterium]|nr:hypothetical protein [Fibrella sp.]